MTVIWFVIWLIANNIGDHEPLTFDPLNVWAATLILAIALDINRPQVMSRRGKYRLGLVVLRGLRRQSARCLGRRRRRFPKNRNLQRV